MDTTIASMNRHLKERNTRDSRHHNAPVAEIDLSTDTTEFDLPLPCSSQKSKTIISTSATPFIPAKKSMADRVGPKNPIPIYERVGVPNDTENTFIPDVFVDFDEFS